MTELGMMVAAVRVGQRALAAAGGLERSKILQRIAARLELERAVLTDANRQDLFAARASGLAAPLLARLSLSDSKIDVLASGSKALAAMADPVGRVLRATELDTGLVLRQVSSPLGVVLVIFESRPDAVIQIGSLALRAGCGVILKGGSEAAASNAALVGLLQRAVSDVGLDPHVVAAVSGREEVSQMLALDQSIDLVIPRGSGELVRTIQASTRIPVLGHAEGICHLVIDAAADPQMARRIAVDAKCDAPSACNAVETILVHRAFLPHLPGIAAALADHGVEVRADAEALPLLPRAVAAAPDDFGREFGDLVVALKVVASLDEAIAHIHRYGSGHTEAIVTGDPGAARHFLDRVDSGSVFVNASTRFADGYRYGLGAEVGISTSRLHARGPVGVDGLLTTRWLLEGSGQTVAEYSSGDRHLSHRALPLSR